MRGLLGTLLVELARQPKVDRLIPQATNTFLGVPFGTSPAQGAALQNTLVNTLKNELIKLSTP